jgi:hypothetical protein
MYIKKIFFWPVVTEPQFSRADSISKQPSRKQGSPRPDQRLRMNPVQKEPV